MKIFKQVSGRILPSLYLPAMYLIFISNYSFAQTGLPYNEIDLSNLNEFQAPSENWSIAGDVFMDLYERRHVQAEAGSGVLVNTSEGNNPLDIFTAWEHGDLDLELEFMIAKESNSGIYLQGRYEIQMLDSWGVKNPRFGDMGGVYQWWEDGVGVGGIPPRVNASRAPGLWQHIQIKFRAPRFDENGVKFAHARLEEVYLNGVMIHENVDLIHPTGGAISNEEAEFGPLRFQGDHGPVAFRNIRYKSYHNNPVELNNITYRYYSGDFETADDVSSGEFVSEGKKERITLDMLRESGEIGIEFAGELKIEEAGEYYFDLRSDGGNRLSINNEVLFESDDSTRRQHSNPATVHMEAGIHPVELTYFRGARGGFPELGLLVEGPGINMHGLHDQASLRIGIQNLPLNLEPVKEPVVMHGFMDSGERVHTHTAAVGYPGGVNFALDQNSGALMKIWKGDFINAATMWVDRGGRNLSLNEDTAINISSAPSLAYLDEDSEAWPDSLQEWVDYKFDNYRFDSNDSVVFSYRFGNTSVTDQIIPDDEGNVLNRKLTFQTNTGSSENNLYVRAAKGDSIDRLPNNLYQVNGKSYFVMVNTETGHSSRIRTTGDQSELLIPVGSSGEFSIEYSYIW